MDKATVVANEGSRKLAVRTKLGFGVADLGGNLFFTAMGFWSMNYLTDTVGIPAALAGMAVMVAKIWDAVTDPMMGYISDRTRSPLGRRRPYMIFGALPLLLSSWLFFTAPALQGPAALTAWAIATLCLLNTAYTVVNIPYGSLTPELTKDYHERTSLNGYRFGFAVIGTILGAAIVLPIVGVFGDKKAGFSAVGLLFGVVMAVTALITGFSVRERPHDGDRGFSALLPAPVTSSRCPRPAEERGPGACAGSARHGKWGEMALQCSPPLPQPNRFSFGQW